MTTNKFAPSLNDSAQTSINRGKELFDQKECGISRFGIRN